mgnify:CR=1 FL=1
MTIPSKELFASLLQSSMVKVLSGLKAGEEIVSRPFTAISKTLKDKMTVKKVDKEKLLTGTKKE